MGLLYGEDRKADALLCPDPHLTSMLFAAHGDIHWRDDSGHTPLTFAAHIGYAAGVRWLIEQRAEVNGTAADGRTALNYATHYRFEPVVQTVYAKFLITTT